MRILSVNKYYWKKGGSEAVFFAEKQILENKGHEVIPFSMKSAKNLNSPYTKYFVDEIDYEKGGVFNKLSSASKIIYSIDARRKIDQLLTDHLTDLAHFHIFQHQISPSVFGPLKKRGIPIVLTLHDLKPICPNYKMLVNGRVCEKCEGRKFYHCTLNRCTKGSFVGSFTNTIEMYFHYLMGYYQQVDQYIAPSRFIRDKFIEFGFPKQQITYLPNFIDANQYDAIPRDERYVLYFGRLSNEKGLPTLLQSAALTPDITYRIVGSGPMETTLKKRAEEQNLRNVTFHGHKSGEEMDELLSGATCVVLPSEWYENCPMTILEAYASGKPVIGTNIGGIPELIEDDIDGLIVPPGDAEILAEKIRKLWRNPARASDMGQMGRRKIMERFNPEMHYHGLHSVYCSAYPQ